MKSPNHELKDIWMWLGQLGLMTGLILSGMLWLNLKADAAMVTDGRGNALASFQNWNGVQVIQGEKKTTLASASNTIPSAIRPPLPVYKENAHRYSAQTIYDLISKYNHHLNQAETYICYKSIDIFSLYFNLDPKLLTSLVAAESSFNPKAISKSGALGLGQLKPQTAQWLGVRNPFDPVDNLYGSAKYLRYLLDKYHGSVRHALAAYYQGQGTIDRAGINEEAERYIVKITRIFNQMS